MGCCRRFVATKLCFGWLDVCISRQVDCPGLTSLSPPMSEGSELLLTSSFYDPCLRTLDDTPSFSIRDSATAINANSLFPSLTLPLPGPPAQNQYPRMKPGSRCFVRSMSMQNGLPAWTDWVEGEVEREVVLRLPFHISQVGVDVQRYTVRVGTVTNQYIPYLGEIQVPGYKPTSLDIFGHIERWSLLKGVFAGPFVVYGLRTYLPCYYLGEGHLSAITYSVYVDSGGPVGYRDTVQEVTELHPYNADTKVVLEEGGAIVWNPTT
ncbi:hypothetical protein BKA93DRAFT_807935 [Sparassis latifolia]